MELIYEAERIYYKNEQGRMAAEVTFHQRSDRAMSIDHTYVSPELRGQGAADRRLHSLMVTRTSQWRRWASPVRWAANRPENVRPSP